MKDLVIGCSTNYTWDTLKYWVNSIKKSGFDGHVVLILMNCDSRTVTKICEAGVDVVAFKSDENKNLVYQNSQIPVHVERFVHIYEFLDKFKDYRYVITTDVKDVIFQKNPSHWLEQNIGHNNCVFSSESIHYKNEPWGNQNLLETYGPYIYEKFKDKEIFNVGVLAGTLEAIKSLSINIFQAAINRPIPICDQSTFNFLISQEPYLSKNLYTRSEDGWACQLGTTGDPSKLNSFLPNLLESIPKLENNKIVTSTGKEFTIVHQYDRVPSWRKILEEKYND